MTLNYMQIEIKSNQTQVHLDS